MVLGPCPCRGFFRESPTYVGDPFVPRTHVSWPGDMCCGQETRVLARTHVSRPGSTDRDRRIREFFRLRRQKVKVRGSPETSFGQVSGQSEPSSGGKRTFKVRNLFRQSVFVVEKGNVGNHLKRVLAKFRADRSHPRGVNGRSKTPSRILLALGGLGYGILVKRRILV